MKLSSLCDFSCSHSLATSRITHHPPVDILGNDNRKIGRIYWWWKILVRQVLWLKPFVCQANTRWLTPPPLTPHPSASARTWGPKTGVMEQVKPAFNENWVQIHSIPDNYLGTSVDHVMVDRKCSEIPKLTERWAEIAQSSAALFRIRWSYETRATSIWFTLNVSLWMRSLKHQEIPFLCSYYKKSQVAAINANTCATGWWREVWGTLSRYGYGHNCGFPCGCLDESTRTSWSGTPTTGVASMPFCYCVKGSQQILWDRNCGGGKKKKKKGVWFHSVCSQSLTWRERNQWMKWRNW